MGSRGAGEGQAARSLRPGRRRGCPGRRFGDLSRPPLSCSPPYPRPGATARRRGGDSWARSLELKGQTSCLPFQRGAPSSPRPGFLLREALFPAPSHSPGLSPLLPPTSSRQVRDRPPGLALSGRGACSCQSQKYSLMTQLEDRSPVWLLQAKFRAGGDHLPPSRAPVLAPAHPPLFPGSCLIERGPRRTEGADAFCLRTNGTFRSRSTSAATLLSHLMSLLCWVLEGHGCHGMELDRELVLAKVKALFLDALGPPTVTGEGEVPGIRRLPRRHTTGDFIRRGSKPEEEDVSQAILFPATGATCEDEAATGVVAPEASEGLFTYVFRPSQHTRSHQVISAQLWFHTGLDRKVSAASNSSRPLLDLLVLSSGGPVAVPMSLGQAPPRWAVLRLATSALPLLTHPVLVLLLRCPLCSCSARPETTPFLVAHTRARPPTGGERARRSTPPMPWPWSPAALRLLQRPPEEPTVHAYCHRAALNISFQELGWDRWIVHPPSFIFHYCHGGCGLPTPPDLLQPVPGVPPTSVQPLTLVPGAQPCCAALLGTMRPLHVRTTSDGGYSFKYETVPNLLTQHCACI